jgi:glycerate-2-kinase
MVSVKSATSDVPSVSVPLETVLPAPLEDIFTTLLVGTTAQESSMPMEDVLTNAHPVTSDNPIKSASRAQLNARLAAATQLA